MVRRRGIVSSLFQKMKDIFILFESYVYKVYSSKHV